MEAAAEAGDDLHQRLVVLVPAPGDGLQHGPQPLLHRGHPHHLAAASTQPGGAWYQGHSGHRGHAALTITYHGGHLRQQVSCRAEDTLHRTHHASCVRIMWLMGWAPDSPSSVGSVHRWQPHTKCQVCCRSRTRWLEPSCGVV